MVDEMVVVDAANVVGSRPDGWWRDRAGAARRLLDALEAAPDVLTAEVVVVLEGAAKRAVDPGAVPAGRMRVVLAEGSGDDTIVDVVASAHARQVTVVTADRGLRQRVEALGARTVGPRWLLDAL
ncbi:rRNA-processing protein FCF1 [Nocardia transvalensis]|uniref:rRNA-processing protein FCF1 n=1 Tax=Nocardia transvalensis TaxID=37333 RepID=A0A7W9PN03_9NOCA|nr:rRNA-processing protein FCF1 [Nocardia transvalensis]